MSIIELSQKARMLAKCDLEHIDHRTYLAARALSCLQAVDYPDEYNNFDAEGLAHDALAIADALLNCLASDAALLPPDRELDVEGA